MTEKRFKLIADSNLEYLMQAELKLPIYDYNDNKKRLSLKNALDLLNSLSDENEQLNLNYNELRYANDIYCKTIDSLKKENKQLKSELEEVTEVCRKYGIYKEELQSVLADFDKILSENGERAIRYKYCVNSR